MRIIVDRDTRKVRLDNEVQLKRGDQVPVELRFTRDGRPSRLADGEGITIALRRREDFDEGVLAALEETGDEAVITRPERNDGFYRSVASLDLNTTSINGDDNQRLVFATAAIAKEEIYLEVKWTEGSDTYSSENAPAFLYNKVSDLNPATPGGVPGSISVPFVTIGNTASLTHERALAVTAGQLTLTDGGAGASATLSLADSGASASTYGSGTAVPVLAVDAKGRITSASTTAVTPSWASITSKPTTLSGYGISDAQPLHADLTAFVTNCSWSSANLTLAGNFAATDVLATGNLTVQGDGGCDGEFAAGSFTGDGSGLTALNGTQVSTGTVALARGGTGSGTASGARTNLGVRPGVDVQAYSADLDEFVTHASWTGSELTLPSLVLNTNLFVGLTATATTFVGSGSGLTDISGTQVTTGTVALARGGTGSGTASGAQTNLGFLKAYKTGDTTRTTNVTPAADPDLVIPIVANGVYDFEFRVFLDTESATPNWKGGLTFPSSPTAVQWTMVVEDHSGGTVSSNGRNTGDSIANSVTVDSTDGATVVIKGHVQNGSNAGNISLLWSQDTSSADDTTVLRCSYAIAQKRN